MNAQTSDLFRVEYLYVPNSKAGGEINRFRTLFQLPLKIKERNYIIVGGEYRYVNLQLENLENIPESLSSVQRIEGSLGYLYQFPEEWILAFKAGVRIESTFDSKLVSDDFIYVTNFYAIRDRTDSEKYEVPNRLIFGLEYTTTAGRNFPLPIINYYREFHPKWTYTLGVPKTNLRYKFNQTHHLQAYATIDNFFANIQKNLIINDQVAENVSSLMVVAGLGYELYFTDHLLGYFYLGHTILNDYRFRDNNRDDIFIIEDRNTLYFRTGIKFKI